MFAQIIEYEGWGLNWLTISFLLTVLFDIAEGVEVFRQACTVKNKEKAKSLSVMWFCYFGCLLMCLGIYGVVGIPGISIAMIMEGVLGFFFYIPMMYLLWVYKGYNTKEKFVLGISFLMLPAIFILPWKDIVIMIFTMGAILALITIPWEIWKEKSRGQVEIGLLAVYMLNVFFWMIYGFAAHITPLMVVTPIGIIILLVAIILWWLF